MASFAHSVVSASSCCRSCLKVLVVEAGHVEVFEPCCKPLNDVLEVVEVGVHDVGVLIRLNQQQGYTDSLIKRYENFTQWIKDKAKHRRYKKVLN